VSGSCFGTVDGIGVWRSVFDLGSGIGSLLPFQVVGLQEKHVSKWFSQAVRVQRPALYVDTLPCLLVTGPGTTDEPASG
jgi:hypothetical protein